MATILMMSSKLATPGLLKVKVFQKVFLKLFQNKIYDVITYVHDITKKILSCNSNYIVDVVM